MICTLPVVISRNAFHVENSNRIRSIWHGNTTVLRQNSSYPLVLVSPLISSLILLAAQSTMKLELASSLVCTNRGVSHM